MAIINFNKSSEKDCKQAMSINPEDQARLKKLAEQ